jgi:peptide/nickel transport system permease protein
MLRYILRRLGYGLLILIGVNLLTFFLFFTVNTPDDMARLNIGGKRITQEQIDKWKAERGYDRPLYFNAEAQGTEQDHPHRAVGAQRVADAAGLRPQ